MTSDVLVEESYQVTPEAIVRYAGASGDFTAMHYDQERLQQAGYEEFFAMGMLVAGRLGALLARTFGDDAIRELRVRFVSPSWVGRTVTCTLQAAAAVPDAARLSVDLVARDETGAIVAAGSALVETHG